MKTIFVKVASVLLAISMLTSCLGDGDNYIEVSEDFAYIRTDEMIGKYAMTLRSGPLKSDKVDNLETGRAYYVSYKATYGNGGYGVAERFELIDKYPVPLAQFFFNEEPYFNVPEDLKNDTVNVKNMDLGACAAVKEYFDDYWEVRYNVAKKEGDEFEVYFYYDKDGQYENGEPLDENQAIIDVRFVKTFKSGSSQDAKNETLKAMGSLKMFREMYRPTYNEGEDYANVAIKFRYIKENTNADPSVSYIGSFFLSGSSSQPSYYMTFSRKS